MTRGIYQNGIYLKVEREKTKLRMRGGSWTLNLADVPLTDPALKLIRFVTESAVYEISASDALMNGFNMILGGEEKRVVPIIYWTVTAK